MRDPIKREEKKRISLELKRAEKRKKNSENKKYEMRSDEVKLEKEYDITIRMLKSAQALLKLL